ncbi:ribonuclease domain-containing protein [Kitasatospora kifunensis]|uniref:Ribonuclease T1 n=1 Tax=Kitasatospora kifunensis TaxID=58351 RepID=A0A7W7VUY5_KITKI|nr:ribonuclease domain-containing protein [Kitasatospora kifunensis]MBB4923114.1 ribonuclease T1 [Kitasatospora kifunensis]
MRISSRLRLVAVAVLLLCAVAAAALYATEGHKSAAPAAGSATTAAGGVCQSRLPSQARDTLALIGKGGPYPYRTDGVVFDNREKRLPKEPSGYYHEYTVVTPGSGDRGARRIVTGGAGEEYWTADHYASFQKIDARC